MLEEGPGILDIDSKLAREWVGTFEHFVTDFASIRIK
jgi:hypothetical protein